MRPELSETEDGLQVVFDSKRLYGPRPRESALRRVQTVPAEPGTLLLLPSPLIGYGIGELLRTCDPSVGALAVEADPGLWELFRPAFSELRDEFPDRLFYAEAQTEAALDAFLADLPIRRFRRCRLMSLNGGFRLHSNVYRHFLDTIETAIRVAWQNRMTLMHMGRLWMRNIARNLGLAIGGRPLSELSTRKPVVVIGAGTSLDEAISYLSAHRERYYLLAVDTALGALAARSIQPDAVMALEGQAINARDFVAHPDRESIDLICDLTSAPTVVRLFPAKRRHFVLSEFASTVLLDRLEEQGIALRRIPPLGSVGIAATLIARELTDADVYLLGLDFAYPTGRPHAKSCPSHLLYLHTTTRLTADPLFGLTLRGSVRSDLDGMRSDMVLDSYAADLHRRRRDLPRVHDLGLRGEASPGVLASGKSGRDLSEDREAERGAAAKSERETGGSARAHRAWSDRARAFLEREVNALDALRERLVEALNETDEGRYGRAAAAVLEQIEALDYVYLHFPDDPGTQRSFLKRSLVAAGYYRDRFARGLSLLATENGEEGGLG